MVENGTFRLRVVYGSWWKNTELILSRITSESSGGCSTLRAADYTLPELLTCYCALKNKGELFDIRPQKNKHFEKLHPTVFEKLARQARVMTGYSPRAALRAARNPTLTAKEKIKIAAPSVAAFAGGMAACAGVGYLTYKKYIQN